MAVNRREFFQTAGLTGVAATLGTGLLASGRDAAHQEGAVLRLSSQEGRIPGATLAERVERMADWGFSGIEPSGGGLSRRVAESRQKNQIG